MIFRTVILSGVLSVASCKQNASESDTKSLSELAKENKADSQKPCPAADSKKFKFKASGSAKPQAQLIANAMQNLPEELVTQLSSLELVFEETFEKACGNPLETGGFCLSAEKNNFRIGIVVEGGTAMWQHDLLRAIGQLISQASIRENNLEKPILSEQAAKRIYSAFITDIENIDVAPHFINNFFGVEFGDLDRAKSHILTSDHPHDQYMVSRIVGEAMHSTYHCDAKIVKKESELFADTISIFKNEIVKPFSEAQSVTTSSFSLVGITELFGSAVRGLTPGSGSFLNFREGYRYATMDNTNRNYSFRNVAYANYPPRTAGYSSGVYQSGYSSGVNYAPSYRSYTPYNGYSQVGSTAFRRTRPGRGR